LISAQILLLVFSVGFLITLKNRIPGSQINRFSLLVGESPFRLNEWQISTPFGCVLWVFAVDIVDVSFRGRAIQILVGFLQFVELVGFVAFFGIDHSRLFPSLFIVLISSLVEFRLAGTHILIFFGTHSSEKMARKQQPQQNRKGSSYESND